MKIQITQIDTFLQQLLNTSISYTINFQSENANLHYDGVNVLNDIFLKYGNRSIIHDEDVNPQVQFYTNWQAYKLKNDFNYSKMWDAYSKEYEPLENYHRTETHTGGHSDTETRPLYKETTTNLGGHSETESFPETYRTTTTKTGGHSETESFPSTYKSTTTKSGGHKETETYPDDLTTEVTKTGGHEETETPNTTTTKNTTGSVENNEVWSNYTELDSKTGVEQTSVTHGETVENKAVPYNSDTKYTTGEEQHRGTDTTTTIYGYQSAPIENTKTINGAHTTTNDYGNTGVTEETTASGHTTKGFEYDNEKETTVTSGSTEKEFLFDDEKEETIQSGEKKQQFSYDQQGEKDETIQTGKRKQDFEYASGGEKQEHTFEGSIIHTTNYNNEKIETYGNIGVTTSQQMLESELSLRKTQLINDYIFGFIHEYTFLI